MNVDNSTITVEEWLPLAEQSKSEGEVSKEEFQPNNRTHLES